MRSSSSKGTVSAFWEIQLVFLFFRDWAVKSNFDDIWGSRILSLYNLLKAQYQGATQF